MMKTAPTYHIIGAGLAGLFCAYQIKQKKIKAKVIVYEASVFAGGRCYSYEDKEFEHKLDNATHVICSANKKMRKFISANEWEGGVSFWDAVTKEVKETQKSMLPHVLMSICNTDADMVAKRIIKTIKMKTFPWTYNRQKVFFSKQDLSQRIINNLAAFADKIEYECKLEKIETQFGRAVQLNFNRKQVEIGAEDKIILALDNHNYAKLMNERELPHNSIINIFYKTSEKLYLPKSASVIGVVNGIADWVFVNDKILGVTISNANDYQDSLSDLAVKVWKELDAMRGVNSAFLPQFKAFRHKYATISQDEKTNSLRPDNAKTIYPNVFIAGDWTMKNHPCCMETAFLSAKRAIKTSLK